MRRSIQSPALCCSVACLLCFTGCTGTYTSEFSLIIVNRTANTIEAMANGNALGNVTAGQSGTYSLTLPESNANRFSNGVAPTPQASIVLTAKDTRTGVLSNERATTLSKGTPTYVSFTAEDFPSRGPTIARFTLSPTTATINQDVSFNATSSTVTNGTYEWDFGDGTRGTGATITQRYTRAGTFTVTLIVTSDTKAMSSASRTITIFGAITAPNFTFTPASPSINQPVTFTAAQLPAGTSGTYTWDYGDRTSGTGNPSTYRYTAGGSYTVTLRFTSDAGLSATTARQITVAATLPAGSASFTFSPTNPRVNDDVYFNASASIVNNATYFWDFGDGTSGEGLTTIHRYSIKRAFTVTLTVTNDLGQRAVADRVVTLSDP